MFSAGLDVPVLLKLDKQAMENVWRDFYSLLGALASSPIPIVAAITGHAPAGGTVLALFCDHRVASAEDQQRKLQYQIVFPCRRATWGARTNDSPFNLLNSALFGRCRRSVPRLTVLLAAAPIRARNVVHGLRRTDGPTPHCCPTKSPRGEQTRGTSSSTPQNQIEDNRRSVLVRGYRRQLPLQVRGVHV